MHKSIATLLLLLPTLAMADKPTREVGRCVSECEMQTEGHFMKVYGRICNPETKDGQRILARMAEYDETMEQRDVRYSDDHRGCNELKGKSGKQLTTARCKNPMERGSSCDDNHLRKISRFDMFNNSVTFKSDDPAKKVLNGTLAKGQRAPFDYGIQCVAQCRDPEAKISGRDTDAEQIHNKKPVPMKRKASADGYDSGIDEGGDMMAERAMHEPRRQEIPVQ